MATLAKYCPKQPHPQQQLFLDLEDREALFGGAAGGGKSIALLMAALQYVDTPGYKAIIFRRTWPELQDLIEESHDWLDGKADWNQQQSRWKFPNKAYLWFGHAQYANDVQKYKGPAYNYIGWDELTLFLESQYVYMFSRQRKPKTGPLSRVPIRVRAGTNPDGPGRLWVRNRFVPDTALKDFQGDGYKRIYHKEHDIIVNGRTEKHRLTFVPSQLQDNPSLDMEDYERNSLSQLAPVTREQLRRGDWRISEEGLIREEWLRYYDMQGEHLRPRKKDNAILTTFDCREHYRFATVDTAGTSKQIAEMKKKSKASWSVMAIWDCVRSNGKPLLFLRHVWRERVGYIDLKENVVSLHKQWGVQRTLIENAHIGPQLAEESQKYIQCELVSAAVKRHGIDTGKSGKVERAKDLFIMLSEGRVYLPVLEDSWKPYYEAELLAWTGDEDEPADQIDVSSHAARHVSDGGAGGRLVGMMPIMSGRVFN